MKIKSIILNLIITLIIGLIIFAIFLPPLNHTSIYFWVFISSLIIIYAGINLILENPNIDIRLTKNNRTFQISTILILIIIIIISLTNFILSPFFNSKEFSKRITIDESSEFIKDIPLVDLKALPLLDKASSTRIGDRVMGQMPELVSQFYVSNLYTQINYNNDIVRVTPLEYNGFFKMLANYKEGIKGYITVNSVDGSAELTKLKNGMKYMPSAILLKDLNRHLRFKYPTKIFGEKSFEIDNDGNPYWTIPTIKYTGINQREEIEGLIILDPISGESNYYKTKDIPSWVDHVYTSSLVLEQINDWGKYRNGFFNSIFGQKNVVATTEGYNYTIINDDVYLYTGITSVSTDESNIGFVLTNLRTKETKFYNAPGAEEYSAMASAEGQVQQMRYNATFPLLINLNNKPTYLISLKDAAGLVKMYALVDVADYQKVVVTDSSKGISTAIKNYLSNDFQNVDDNNSTTKQIKITSISTTIIDGNTYYYFKDTNNKKYSSSITINKNKLPFIKVGDTIEISYLEEKEVIEIVKIK